MPALLTSSQSVWLIPKPQATTSVQLGCFAAQGIRVIYTIILAPPQPWEREQPPKQGLTEGKSLSTNLSTTAANHSRSSAAADQWGSTGNNSRRWVKTQKPTQWKAAWGWCSAHGSVQPKESGTSTPASQLLTQKPFLTVIPLMLLYQRDGLCKGRLKKTSSGQEKKKIK